MGGRKISIKLIPVYLRLRGTRKRPRSETEQDEATPIVSGITQLVFRFLLVFSFLSQSKYFQFKNKRN